LKYVGAWAARVNKPQMAPVCVSRLISSGLDRSNDFQGIDNCKNIKRIMYNKL